VRQGLRVFKAQQVRKEKPDRLVFLVQQEPLGLAEPLVLQVRKVLLESVVQQVLQGLAGPQERQALKAQPVSKV
jgi:hypothetical protein